MNSLNFFQKEIVQVTKCNHERAKEVEDYMKNVIFGDNLGHVKCSDFYKGAREAHAMLQLSITDLHLN